MHLLKFLRQKTEGRRKIFSAFALVSLIRHHHHKSLICRSAHIKKFENRDFNQTDYIVGLHSCVEYVCPHKVCSQFLVRAIIFSLANLWDEFRIKYFGLKSGKMTSQFTKKFRFYVQSDVSFKLLLCKVKDQSVAILELFLHSFP